MTVSFFSTKGGVGKTTLAQSVAKDLGDFYIISNDDSLLESHFPDNAKIVKEIGEVIEGHDIVYDLGGYLAEDTEKIIAQSDVVVVPTTMDGNGIYKTINVIREAYEYNSNIIMVMNMLTLSRIKKHKDQVEGLEKFAKEYNIPVFKIRNSESFYDASFTGESFGELYSSSPLYKHAFRYINKEYFGMLKMIREKANNKG